jgi:excisionase family DNA binding protein
MPQATKSPRAPRITIQQAAEYLGVSTWTVRRRIADGTLTGYRITNSRAIRLDRAEVEQLLRPIPTTGGGAA